MTAGRHADIRPLGPDGAEPAELRDALARHGEAMRSSLAGDVAHADAHPGERGLPTPGREHADDSGTTQTRGAVVVDALSGPGRAVGQRRAIEGRVAVTHGGPIVLGGEADLARGEHELSRRVAGVLAHGTRCVVQRELGDRADHQGIDAVVVESIDAVDRLVPEG